MAGDTTICVVGNLTDNPELRFVPSGAAVANFTVASTPRSFDRTTNEWKDGETLFLRCSIWRDAAENVAESLTKGTRVIVQGRLQQRSYEKDGEKRTAYELQVEEVGPSLRYASAKVTKTERGDNQGPNQGGWGNQPQQGQGWGQQGSQQPPGGQQGGWGGQPPQGQQQPAQQGGGWNAQGYGSEEPPF